MHAALTQVPLVKDVLEAVADAEGEGADPFDKNGVRKNDKLASWLPKFRALDYMVLIRVTHGALPHRAPPT